MSGTFPVAPTYANPIEKNPTTGRESFSPLWLQWFLDVAQYFTSIGQGGSSILHNGLAGLQGGGAGDYYHLSLADSTALTGPRTLKGVLAADDLIVSDSSKGLVLKDVQATPHYWRVSVGVGGVLSTADLGTVIP